MSWFIKSTRILLLSLLFMFHTSEAMYLKACDIIESLAGLHPYTPVNKWQIKQLNKQVSDDFKKKILQPFLTSVRHTKAYDCSPYLYTLLRLDNIWNTTSDTYRKKRENIIYEGLQLAWYYTYVGEYIDPTYDYVKELQSCHNEFLDPLPCEWFDGLEEFDKEYSEEQNIT